MLVLEDRVIEIRIAPLTTRSNVSAHVDTQRVTQLCYCTPVFVGKFCFANVVPYFNTVVGICDNIDIIIVMYFSGI